jgi:hypothetical protein
MTRFASKAGLAAILFLTLGLSGCGYSLAGRGSFLPAYIKTIGLPLFGNLTPIPDVERRITDKVRTELIGRGRYTIKSETTGVDATLTGQILAIGVAPAAFNQQQQAIRHSVTIVASIEFKDLKTGKVLWSNPSMAYTEQYDTTSLVGGAAAATATEFLGNNVNAVERLASEFARAVVSAILEAF